MVTVRVAAPVAEHGMEVADPGFCRRPKVAGKSASEVARSAAERAAAGVRGRSPREKNYVYAFEEAIWQ